MSRAARVRARDQGERRPRRARPRRHRRSRRRRRACPFFDHMLAQLGKHGGFDLVVRTKGDLEIDAHHTVEDTAIALGQALREALGDKAGIRRFGDALVPLDEALVQVAVDLSGRPYLVHTEPEIVELIGSLRHHADPAHLRVDRRRRAITLHVNVLAGRNAHHVVEAQFKAFARALRDAVAPDPRVVGVPSTKGSLLSRVGRDARARRDPHRRRDLVRPQPPLASGDGARGRSRARRSPPPSRGCRAAAMSPRVVVLDYGSGNIRSAERALARAGADVTVTADRDAALACDGLVVPGVGAFAACMAGIRAVRGDEIVGRRLAGGRPVLGICVGMQVLFEHGVEHGVDDRGLGEWPGIVERAARAGAAAHGLEHRRRRPRARCCSRASSDERFYFVHSYAVRRWELVPTNEHAPRAAASPGRRTASRSSPRSRTARCRDPVPPREVRRRRARLLATGSPRSAPEACRMSKERARRRAEREAAAAAEREKREQEPSTRAQRAAVAGTVTAPVGKARTRFGRWWRRKFPPNDPLAPRRRRRFLVRRDLRGVAGRRLVVRERLGARLWVFLLVPPHRSPSSASSSTTASDPHSPPLGRSRQ